MQYYFSKKQPVVQKLSIIFLSCCFVDNSNHPRYSANRRPGCASSEMITQKLLPLLPVYVPVYGPFLLVSPTAGGESLTLFSVTAGWGKTLRLNFDVHAHADTCGNTSCSHIYANTHTHLHKHSHTHWHTCTHFILCPLLAQAEYIYMGPLIQD